MKREHTYNYTTQYILHYISTAFLLTVLDMAARMCGLRDGELDEEEMISTRTAKVRLGRSLDHCTK